MPESSASLTGRVFDIQRFSVHDGSGIRTNVFLKGCPLRCLWCQNPEGIDTGRRPIWVESDCIGCGTCLREARAGGIREDEGKISIDPDADEDFDAIIFSCPSGALRWNSEDLTVHEVMDRIRRDVPFYAHGSGGVTLSGGDPLAQPDFSEALLRACGQEGIHTAMETELYADWEEAARMLPHLDELYADLKLTDPAAARKYTGRRPEKIMQNLRHLLEGPFRDRVTVRTPLIPGITATDENIASIARFLSGIYSDTAYELLNYNPLAAGKYALVGRKYALDGMRPLTAEQIEHFRDVARQNGIRNLISET